MKDLPNGIDLPPGAVLNIRADGRWQVNVPEGSCVTDDLGTIEKFLAYREKDLEAAVTGNDYPPDQFELEESLFD